MKRFISFHESGIPADGWLFWLVVVLGVLVLALALATTAAAGTAYFSFQGAFTNGSETQSFQFNTDAAISSAETFSLRTWHYSGTPFGQTNAAGDVIPGGGFNPILRLYAGETLIAVDDDIDRSVSNYDAELTWRSADYSPPEIALRDPFRTGDYRLDMRALSGGGSHWAVDLVGPADKLTLTGVDNTGATTITSLKVGSDDPLALASLQLGPFENLSISDLLAVGNTGAAEVTITTGSLSSSYAFLGFAPGSVGSVILSLGGYWEVTGIYSPTYIGNLNGEGNLRVESGSLAQFSGSLVLGENPAAEGNVTVTGHDSYLVANGSLVVAESGVGYVRVEDQGQVNSAGTVLGNWAASHGTGEVDGLHSLWQTGTTIIGDKGQGTVFVTGGGKIATTGNAYIGRDPHSHDSSVTLSGIAPDLTPSTWQVSGNLYVAGSESGWSGAPNSKLTIYQGGLVDVAGTTTIMDWAGFLELLGGELKTGSFIVKPGATFTHTDGVLTVDGGTFDVPGNFSYFGQDWYQIRSASVGDLAVVRLINSATWSPAQQIDVVEVGNNSYFGQLELRSGSTMALSGNTELRVDYGEVLVTGSGSSVEMQTGSIIVYDTLRIQDGGRVEQFGNALNFINASRMDVSGSNNGVSSTYRTHGYLSVGEYPFTSGMLEVTHGGLVDAVGDVADFFNGSVTVSDPNSLLNVAGIFRVSFGGDGATLKVANDGLVTVGDTLTVGLRGTVELDDAIISTGNLELAGGTLRGNGSIIVSGQLTNSGVVAPGFSAGSINISGGNYEQDAAGTLQIEIGSPLEYDCLNVTTGWAWLNGTLAISLIDPAGGTNVYVPNAGDAFQIVTAAGNANFSGALQIAFPTLRGGLLWSFGHFDSFKSIDVGVVGVLGDYSRNGVVDAADYVVWRYLLGQSGSFLAERADGDGDGVVDIDDYDVWRAHFGQLAVSGTTLGATSVSDAIPEPTTLWLAVILGVTYTLIHRLLILRLSAELRHYVWSRI